MFLVFQLRKNFSTPYGLFRFFIMSSFESPLNLLQDSDIHISQKKIQ